MTRKTFEIVLVILGIILGSMVSFTAKMIPTQVTVVTNQDAKLRIKDSSGAYVTSIDIGDLDYLPVHYENGSFKFSSTLDMDNLDGNGSSYRYQNIYSVSLDKEVDNAYLYAELVIDSEDEIANAIRARVMVGSEEIILSKEEPNNTLDCLLTTSDQSVVISLWFELEDESCSIDNINASEGVDIALNLYANVEE